MREAGRTRISLLGIYLAVHFFQLIPYAAELFSSVGLLPTGELSPLLHLFPNVLALWDGPVFVTGLSILGFAAALALILNYRPRTMALFCWYTLACFFGRNPLIGNPALPYIGLILLVIAIRPKHGTLVLWVAMAVGYTYSGLVKLGSPSWLDGTALFKVLHNPLARVGLVRDLALRAPLQFLTWGSLALEILFAPLALWRRTRPYVWSAMLLMHLSLIALINFANLSLGMVMLHIFTFDPHWIPARKSEKRLLIRYDGQCGLCHHFVRFVLTHDPGDQFLFEPLTGEATTIEVEDETRSRAVALVLLHLGGLWRPLGRLILLIPRPLADGGYRLVAATRHQFFSRPKTSCPALPADLRERFARKT